MRLVILAICIPWCAAAQTDSLVRWKDIDFLSYFEKQAFTKWFKQNDRSALLDLMMSTDVNPQAVIRNANERIDKMVARLQPEITPKRKPEKYVKTVYDQVHSSFLSKYELINRFPEVFKTGNYNCVTATALYAFIFEDLKIPYAIQEKPTHVFLVAFPKQNNILVESTAPIFGYLTYDARYKQNFVDNMKSMKLIGESEAQTQDVEELFNKYFFQSEDITLPQLVGIHYMNDALYYQDVKDYEKSLQQIEKSHFFYPSHRVSYTMMGIVVQALSLTQPKPVERATLIGRAAKFSKLGITPNMIKGEFAMLTDAVLTRDNNKPLYRQCYEIIAAQIDDPQLKSDIGYYYNFEIGRQLYNQGSYTQAKMYFAKGLEHQPNNAELGSIFISTLANSLKNETRTGVFLDTLARYQERFPNLKENNKFLTLMSVGYLMAYEEAMKDGKAAVGESYQGKFEALKKENPDIDVPLQVIGAAYSAAGSYYFRKGQKTKAKAIIDRGLEYAPGEFQLRQRRQMLN
ncbi:MAG: hypothetical protein JNK10_11760 [Cyclobacteriaceae bacterium]|nr:hypothetical protein [Cyclobacteriaceae bacterium]